MLFWSIVNFSIDLEILINFEFSFPFFFTRNRKICNVFRENCKQRIETKKVIIGKKDEIS